MAPGSSKQLARPKKLAKRGTTSTNKHRYESFNQRIEKLKIDPVRKRRQTEAEEEGEVASYFRTSLDRWRDTNLSENFSNFAREVDPLCNTLTQILYHRQQLFEILAAYIDKGDLLSLEPLLDLLSNFAHDLNARFEIHFSRAVSLVASLAARIGDVEAIEWSFNCLAWLFKYLARLLVPDLRPLFRIMAPLLGRARQKIHIIRFAAEAMSFLVRKTALIYHKDRKPLENIIDSMRDDILELQNSEEKGYNVEFYQHGIMTLLLNSIKGIEGKLHSCGAHIYRCIISRMLEGNDGQHNQLASVAYGVTVALIRKNDATEFQPILNIVLDYVRGLDTSSSNGSITRGGHLLFIVCTAWKGSRIKDWTIVLDVMLALLELCKVANDEAISEIYKAAAVTLQSSPLEHVLPRFHSAMAIIASDAMSHHFLSFCICFSDCDRERYENLLSPYFSKFIVSQWRKYESQLCFSIPHILGPTKRSKLVCPGAWQEHIVRTFRDAIDQDKHIRQCYDYLELTDYWSISRGNLHQIMEALREILRQSLKSPEANGQKARFSFGAGLRSYARYPHREPMSELWLPICNQAAQYGTLPSYLEAVLVLVESGVVGSQVDKLESLVQILVENLRSSSHTLRKLSLQIIDALCTRYQTDCSECIATMLAIQSSPLDLQSARYISMQVRKLPSLYDAVASHGWLRKAVPYFCFGLLTFKFSQIWDDAISVLKEICEKRNAEEAITELAFRWLEQREESSEGAQPTSAQHQNQQQEPLTEFQCSNLREVETRIEDETKQLMAATEHLKAKFEATHTRLPLQISGAPALALRVLLGMPHIAERHSRRLVPIFLSRAVEEAEKIDVDSSREDEFRMAQERDLSGRTLSYKDRKTMVNLFGLFSNPKVLYRSTEVFEALQNLLKNGDVDIQKSALEALFAWKLDAIQPYRDNLLNLLDDARFREEISTFVQVDKHDSAIQDAHRQVLMPILLRLLFGKMVSRSGAQGNKSGQAIKRKAVIGTLARLDEQDLWVFVHIALGQLTSVRLIESSQAKDSIVAQNLLSPRKQLGLVNTVRDMLENLGNRLTPFAHVLMNALLYCLIQAARHLLLENASEKRPSEEISQVSLLKSIQKVGLQSLSRLFQCCPPTMLKLYLPIIFEELLSPRLNRLPIDTAQAVSGILQLLSTWASSQDTVIFLADYDQHTIRATTDCLEIPSAKDEVKIFVVNQILKKVIEFSSPPATSGELVLRNVLRPNADTILDRVGNLLRKSPSKELLESAVQLVSMLAPLVEGSSQSESLLEISTFLLDQSQHRVNPRTKGELLQIIQQFVPLVGSHLTLKQQDRIFNTVCSLFGYFKDRENRTTVSRVLSVLAERDQDLQDVALFCVSLNSFSAKKVDEPDFDERLKAFNAINESKYKEFTPRQWHPILYNMLFYIRDNDELAIRTNASYALRRFVEMNMIPESSDSGSSSESSLKHILLPALRKGATENSELVRIEYLTVMAHLVRFNPRWDEVNDMSALLVDGDEDASFFNNILHIQQHRRLRALRRLANEARQGRVLNASNVALFFIPLIEHFIWNKADDESAHNLSAETITTIGALATCLEWSQFRALFRRYTGYVGKSDLEKIVIKLLGTIIDALSLAKTVKEKMSAGPGSEDLSTLALTMPKEDKLAGDLSNTLLPSLEKYIHEKDESTVSLRVPMAISAVKLLKILPSDRFRERLPPVLTDICHILRSRAQESRDLTRKTLAEISTLIGPAYFGFILKELRDALKRGYQLHVLAFTVHSILVATSTIFKPGDLDYCLPQIASIIMDDIFGAAGQEKDAEEYISQMKEVKSKSKGYDSMELVAKTATVENIIHLVKPLQNLLEEKINERIVHKIEELLGRIGVGLLRNQGACDQRVLMFCYEIIQEANETGGRSSTRTRNEKEDYHTKRLLVNYHGASKTGNRWSTSSYHFKLVAFSLDILRSMLRKYGDLQTPRNLSAFIPIIRDAILQSNDAIQISALHLLTTIIKVPLKSIDNDAGLYVAECVKIVKNSTSTNSDIAQAALKLVSAILRDRQTHNMRDTHLAYLLKCLKPDLEEPDKQGVAFNFLRAIMTRKIVITEVYEVLDSVKTIMVNNQTKGARDLARGAYIQFIMEYPQSKKGRFDKQLEFLATNLEYKHQEGRQSVIEAIGLLLHKLGDLLVQEAVERFSVPLILVSVYDDSKDCREMAGALVKKVFERADSEHTESLLITLQNFLDRSDEPRYLRLGLQAYSIYLEAKGTEAEKEVPLLQSRMAQIFKTSLVEDPSLVDWELLYNALETFVKICHCFPSQVFTTSVAPQWVSIRRCLSFPHAQVKFSAAKLQGIYFANFARANAGNDSMELPLKNSEGLRLTEQEMAEITVFSLDLLQTPGVSEELASQTGANLLFLAKIMAQTSMLWPDQASLSTSERLEERQGSDDDIDNGPSAEANTALAHIIERTSAVLRRPLRPSSTALIPFKYSLQLLRSLANAITLPTSTLQTILLPLHNLTDPAIPAPFSTDPAFNEGYKTLVNNSKEFMNDLQMKLGITAYMNLLRGVQQGVRERREERRGEKRRRTVKEPEREGERKRRKGVRKKERRKERSGEERGRRRGW